MPIHSPDNLFLSAYVHLSVLSLFCLSVNDKLQKRTAGEQEEGEDKKFNSFYRNKEGESGRKNESMCVIKHRMSVCLLKGYFAVVNLFVCYVSQCLCAR